jgi:hypothetical protein
MIYRSFVRVEIAHDKAAMIGIGVVWTCVPGAAFLLGKGLGWGAVGGWCGFLAETLLAERISGRQKMLVDGGALLSILSRSNLSPDDKLIPLALSVDDPFVLSVMVRSLARDFEADAFARYLTPGSNAAPRVRVAMALAARLRVRGVCAETWTPAALLTLAAMTLGGIYFMETERVWLFALPWIALAAVSAGPFERGALRLILFGGWLQTLAMETGLFTLW